MIARNEKEERLYAIEELEFLVKLLPENETAITEDGWEYYWYYE